MCGSGSGSKTWSVYSIPIHSARNITDIVLEYVLAKARRRGEVERSSAGPRVNVTGGKDRATQHPLSSSTMDSTYIYLPQRLILYFSINLRFQIVPHQSNLEIPRTDT